MLNQTILTGNLGQDPEVFYTNSGDPIAKFSLAFKSSKNKSCWINRKSMGYIFRYSTIPKSLRTIYLKGFKINPIAFIGLTKSHLIIHTLKILKKYHLAGLMVPFMGLSLILSLLPPYVVAAIFILSAGYLAFILSIKFKSKFKKGEVQNA